MTSKNSTPLTPLQKGRLEYQAKLEAGILVRKKRPSWRKAIDDKCEDCIYDPAILGTVPQQIFECACITCPLYSLRKKPIGGGLDRALERMRQDPTHPWWDTPEPQEMGVTLESTD